MFLAGNGLCAATNTGQPRAQVQVPPSKQAGGDCPLVNKPNNPPLCSGLSSPMSVSSHPVGQSGAGCSNEELAVRPMSAVSGTPVSKFDSPKIVTSLGPVAATTMISSGMASLLIWLILEKVSEHGNHPQIWTQKIHGWTRFYKVVIGPSKKTCPVLWLFYVPLDLL